MFGVEMAFYRVATGDGMAPTEHADTQDLAVAVRFGAVIKQEVGDAFVAAVGNGATRCGPGEQPLLELDALRLGMVFGEADPCHFGVSAGHRWNDTDLKAAAVGALNRYGHRHVPVSDRQQVGRPVDDALAVQNIRGVVDRRAPGLGQVHVQDGDGHAGLAFGQVSGSVD